MYGGQAVVDAYTMRARLQPALLAILPVGVATLAWFPKGLIEWGVFAGLLTSAGGMALLARIARMRGKRLETALFERWGGKPSTTALRHRNPASPVLLQRRHKQLSRIVASIRLPGPAQEEADPVLADATYDACVAVLIERTRDRKRFPLLFEENCHYGFWRNLLGLRPIGIACSLVGIVAVVFLMERHGQTLDFKTVVAGSINLSFLLMWLFVVRETTVRMAAVSYSERLLGACEELAP